MTKNITLNNVLALEINLTGDYANSDVEVDLGAVTLTLDNKEFIFDIVESGMESDDASTTINCVLEIDNKTFPDCEFDLQDLDLLSDKLKGTVYFNTDNMEDFKSATLFVKVRQTTKAIELTLDE